MANARKKPGKKSTKKLKQSSSRAVWDRAPPAKAKHSHLSPKKKAAAKARAKRAGRHYPNLVDNMRAAKRK